MQYRRDYTLGATYFPPWLCSADYPYWAVGKRWIFCARPSVPRKHTDLFKLMQWSSCQTTFTHYGHCHPRMPIIPSDGETSNVHSEPAKRPAVFGSRQRKGEQTIWQRRSLRHAQDRFGNIVFVPNVILTIT